MLRPEVIIYTDGACDPNPGPGGWAAILRYRGHEQVLTGSEHDTTNNRMELQAAISALQALKEPCQVELYTDSMYMQQGITAWLPNWMARGWRKRDSKPVLNADLWQSLQVLIQQQTYTGTGCQATVETRRTSASTAWRVRQSCTLTLPDGLPAHLLRKANRGGCQCPSKRSRLRKRWRPP